MPIADKNTANYDGFSLVSGGLIYLNNYMIPCCWVSTFIMKMNNIQIQII